MIPTPQPEYSHDKSFPAALALGSRVFVCDNLVRHDA
jgi:hypothetical protein